MCDCWESDSGIGESPPPSPASQQNGYTFSPSPAVFSPYQLNYTAQPSQKIVKELVNGRSEVTAACHHTEIGKCLFPVINIVQFVKLGLPHFWKEHIFSV